jgi:hypothetical protein
MKTYGRPVTCSKCLDGFIIYADAHVSKPYNPGRWAVSAVCPTCGASVGCIINKDDPEVFEYNIGDTPITEEPEYEWDWANYTNKHDGQEV